ncbi:MAG: hypothetical protein ACKOAX_11545 [Candidatus Kapaibacterium sp.]
MQTRSSMRRRVLRAATYIVSIGGLMILFAGLLWIGWNTFFSHRFAFGSLTLLESMGLVSIAYIVHSSIRFAGGDECATDGHEDMRYDILHGSSGTARPAGNGSTTGERSMAFAGSELSDQQKQDLKKSIEGFYQKTDRDLNA